MTMKEPKRYRVELYRVEYQHATVEVDAESEEEAKERAMDEVGDWTCKDADQTVEYVKEIDSDH